MQEVAQKISKDIRASIEAARSASSETVRSENTCGLGIDSFGLGGS